MSAPSNDGKIQCINCGKSVLAGSAVKMSPDPDGPLVCRWCARIIERRQLSREVDGMKANLQQSFAVDKTLGGLSQSYQACCEYEGLKGYNERLCALLRACWRAINSEATDAAHNADDAPKGSDEERLWLKEMRELQDLLARIDAVMGGTKDGV